MPDLSYQTVHAFWHEYDPMILYRIVCSIEASEGWINSNSDLQSVIEDLGDGLDLNPSAPDLLPETCISLLVSIPFSQALRVMQFLETKESGYVARLLSFADDAVRSKTANKDTENFLRRNMVFERLQLLARIFSQERLDLLSKAKDSAYD